ncbi:MAG: endolytic transglycosylase MltG [Candidatus Hydrogenedentes bacterium]|nr:endolytic transglycosylase MltG [Candidatus Hydrogenedentota bacterium]
MSSEDLLEDARAHERRKFRFWRWITALVLWGIAASVILVAAAGAVGYILYDHVTYEGASGPAVEFAVPRGSTGRDVGRLLADAGLIEYEGFFRLALQLDGSEAVIRHGLYELNQGLSATGLLRQLQAGPKRPLEVDRVKVTIPEGLAIAQAATLLSQGEDYVRAAADPALRERVGAPGESLEGFLMPDTYFFDEAPDADTLVTRQVEHFEAVYASLLSEIPGSENHDRNTIITIASLVEEEARTDEERPLVAAVLYNRLRLGMPLQMDSTLQYALGKYGQRMLNSDKEVDSPYNTYRNAGLPPGPISSPGAASIRAALAPADADYLYFVSNADGKTHTFSTTLAEHEAAVARYRREIAEQRRALGQ